MSPSHRPVGTGPGAITADGCAVDLYAQLPPGREPEIIHAAIPEGASILELGAGAGRITHPLVALGHPVVAVDESTDMLRHIRGAETVCVSIENLRLNRTFDGVVLGSCLINTAAADHRRALLATCRQHLNDSGVLLIEQHPPTFFTRPTTGQDQVDGITRTLSRVDRTAEDLVEATVEYRIADNHWTQTFTARRFDTDELLASGLRLTGLLTPDQSWLAVRQDR